MPNRKYNIDGKKIQIAFLRKKDVGMINEFQKFINSLVGENAQIKLNKPLTLKDEKI